MIIDLKAKRTHTYFGGLIPPNPHFKNFSLYAQVTKLRENRVVKEVARDLLKGGAGAATDSIYIAGLVGGGGASTFGKIGGEAVAKIFGEDVGKEVHEAFSTPGCV